MHFGSSLGRERAARHDGRPCNCCMPRERNAALIPWSNLDSGSKGEISDDTAAAALDSCAHMLGRRFDEKQGGFGK